MKNGTATAAVMNGRSSRSGAAARGPRRATLIPAGKQVGKQAGESGARSVFGFATRRDPATGGRAVSVTRVVDLVRACGLVVVIVTVSLASPGPGSAGARGLAI